MAKIQLDIPTDLHLETKQLQLSMESIGKKITLKNLYYDLIKKGLEYEKKKAEQI